MRCLVTGATGFIGRNLVAYLRSRDWNVFTLERDKPLPVFTYNGYIYDGTITSLNYCLLDCVPDIVFHLAAKCFTLHTIEDLDSIIASNITLGLQLLESMVGTNASCRLVTAGTNWQDYDGTKNNPLNLYAATKTAFQEICKVYTDDIRIINLRLFDNYGKGDTRFKVLNRLVAAIYSGEPVPLVDAMKRLNYTHVKDVCSAFEVAANRLLFDQRHLKQETFDVCGREISIGSLVKRLERISGIKIDVRFGEYPMYRKDCLVPAYSKLLPNWSQKIELDAGLKELIEYAQLNVV